MAYLTVDLKNGSTNLNAFQSCRKLFFYFLDNKNGHRQSNVTHLSEREKEKGNMVCLTVFLSLCPKHWIQLNDGKQEHQ